MKSQDILLLLKLVSLGRVERGLKMDLDGAWRDWEGSSQQEDDGSVWLEAAEAENNVLKRDLYSVRALGKVTGISKSQVSLSLERCYFNGLARLERDSLIPRVNVQALAEFLVHGLRYVFPVAPGPLTRGITTGWAAPVLQESLMSAGSTPMVWSDARGSTMGQHIEPLYKTVPWAIKIDPYLYSLLSLVDAIRVGRARERTLASEKLLKMLKDG
ncbi:MAG: hypothetical protein ACN6OC_16405 [Alcaligenes sp.]